MGFKMTWLEAGYWIELRKNSDLKIYAIGIAASNATSEKHSLGLLPTRGR
jgi:hypothetical protein